MSHQRQKVFIYGNGHFSQWVTIEGAKDSADAKKIARARYPGYIIGQTMAIGYERPESLEPKFSGRSSTNSTSSESASSGVMGSSNSYSSSSSSSGSGLIGLIIGTIVMAGLSFLGGEDDTKTKPNAVPQKVNVIKVAPVVPVQPIHTYTSKEANGCKIWAGANPGLAAKLKPDDRCFGKI